MSKLPLLVSVPHGGDQMPVEIADKVVLSDADLFWDSDACTRRIYHAPDVVEAYVDTHIARAGVDLNREESDLPPANPDGVVKQKTCLGVDLYPGGALPSADDTAALIEQYYRPYHARLRGFADGGNFALALDCHSMLAEGPTIGPDRGEPRPLFCLSNRDGETCANALLRDVRIVIAEAFEVDRHDVRLNDPFKGGYITRHYGAGPLPWIQVEMSRTLYLSPPWFDPDTLEVDNARLASLNAMFRTAVRGIARLVV